jgi:Xaa-Pro aminopeptidase
LDPNDFVISQQEFADRRRRLVELAHARDLKGILVWSKGGGTVDLYGPIFYLTNHYTQFPQIADRPPWWAGRAHAALVLPAEGPPTLISDIPDYRADLVAIEDVRVGINIPGLTGEVMREKRLDSGRLGLVARDYMLAGAYQDLLKALPDVVWVPSEDLFEQVRRVKSPNEIKLIRKACEIGSKACATLMEAVQPDWTEAEAMAEALYVLTREGGVMYDHPVASGQHSHRYAYGRLPSWDHYRRFQPGDLFHVDMYGAFEGYYYDLGRSTVVGRRATQEQKELMETAMASVEAGIAAVRPGATAGEVARAGFKCLEEHGFRITASKEEFERTGEAALNMTFPSMGHGLGMWWELPWLTPDDTTILEPNMVLAIERAVGRPGVGAASYEDDVLITATGYEVLTTTKKRWWV